MVPTNDPRLRATLNLRPARSGSAYSVLLVCAAAAAIVTATSPLRIIAQTQDAPASFDVASIKPHPLSGVPMYRVGPDSFAIQARLSDLVEEAYEIKNYQVVGGPAWTRSDYFDVVAKAATAVSNHQLLAMLQALLADRFHLKLRHETRVMAGYILIADKGGSRLPPPRTDLPADSQGTIRGGPGSFLSRGATMTTLAAALTRKLKQPVLDETTIKGNYDFKLSYEEGQDMDFGGLIAAVRDLGLKLEARRLPIDVLVIEDAARPSAN